MYRTDQAGTGLKFKDINLVESLILDRRKKIITHGLDLRNSIGIEMGPLHAPIVSKSDGPVIYIDHADTDAIIEKYRHKEDFDVSKIVKIDAVWGPQPLKAAVGKTADYIIASHVIEHVPNLIGWLNDLTDALSEHGQIRLAIPDKRYTLDLYRRITSLADVVSAHVQNAKVPLTAQIIDHHLFVRDLNFRDIWNGTAEAYAEPSPFELDRATRLANESIRLGTYNDVHCWVFTPVSFAHLMQQLARLGLVKLKCISLTTTAYEDLEFFAALQKTNDVDDAVASWVQAEKDAALPHPNRKSLPSRIWRRIRPKRR